MWLQFRHLDLLRSSWTVEASRAGIIGLDDVCYQQHLELRSPTSVCRARTGERRVGPFSSDGADIVQQRPAPADRMGE